MNKIIMCKGLPASGKTTWSRNYQNDFPTTVRVNKDELRAMLHNGKHSSGREAFVLKVRNFIVETALQNHQDVIVDDTNLNPVHEAELKALAAKNGAMFEANDFTRASVADCIERDSMRTPRVGEKVIRDMYNQYLRPKINPPEYVMGLRDAIICDLDGTLAINNGRSPYDTARCEEDLVNKTIYNILLNEVESGTSIIFVSGRSDEFKGKTLNWLKKETALPFDNLYMRKSGDIRNDQIIKQEIYDTFIKGKYNIKFVLDDRNRVVEMWRANGLICLQVSEGNF